MNTTSFSSRTTVASRKIVPCTGAVVRVIKLLDELYVFGPTEYYSRFRSMEECVQDYMDVLGGLSLEQIKRGIARIHELDSKKVHPNPSEIKAIFTDP